MSDFFLPPAATERESVIPRGVTRRTLLKSALTAAALGGVSPRVTAWGGERTSSLAEPALAYLQTLARTDGGYAWENQPESHLTPTFASVAAHRSLGAEVPKKAEVAEFLRTGHPFRVKKLERDLRVFEYQQIQGLLWLGEKVASFREQARGWVEPAAYPVVYEKSGYPVLQFEAMSLILRRMLGLDVKEVAAPWSAYLDARRRANGSFNNTPASDGGDGHVVNTWWAIQALDALGRSGEMAAQTIAWVRACQLPSGGFTYQPKPEFAAVDDAVYTWAAIHILKHLGSEPADCDACIRYLHSLQNADGGFGNKPGWLSNPMATYYALDALAALGALDRPTAPTVSRAAGPKSAKAAPPPFLPGDLRVWTIQLEAHGQGSPAEAVDLARVLKIHLWGAKNGPPGWIARAQALADQARVNVTFFVANEEYGTFVRVPGLGTYSHTSDVIAPAGADFGPSLARPEPATWDEFRRSRLAPLQEAGGRLIWQFGENEELVRLYLDDSVQRGGYAAISTFHFGNPDFTNSEPFLYDYREKIPFVALQDAHGGQSWWWGDMLAGFRTLFLAREPSWQGWLEALDRKWVVAVRRDAVSGGKLWMHGGTRQVRDFVLKRDAEWRWWDNDAIRRPLVSLVAVRPDDPWEVPQPKKGVVLRVRCAWSNTTQGLPKAPIAELVRLTVDGAQVAPVLRKKVPAKGRLNDVYHEFAIPDPSPGKHTATAVVRVVATGATADRTTTWTT
ncbi:MAG: prenyltransferase/squalene oxidase repeat-containing protein [Pirellulales bacterium]